MLLNSRSKSWSRLVHFSWDELATRVGQEVGKRWDACLYPALRRLRRTELASDGSGHFFFGRGDLKDIIEAIRSRLPGIVEQTVARAEAICRHQFDLLGYRGLDYGDSIDWHLDAVNGKRAPRKPFYKVRYLDFGEVGDSKVTWELNRHQHLVTLAKAYCFSGDQKYTNELKRQWYHWCQENPYPIGINWASSLEVAFRCLSWLWVRELLAACDAMDAKFSADLQEALLLGGRHIERYLSTYFSPNTHLLGEGVALFFLGILCNGGRTTERWGKCGWDVVLQQAQRQVQPDGMHFEQSTYYHVYACDLFLHARTLAAANGIAIPTDFDRTLERMLEALALLARTGAPRFGDDDGGRLFDPARNRTEHLCDPLCPGAVLFRRSEFKSVSPQLTEEMVWLLGAAAANEFEAMEIHECSRESAALTASGLYLMSSTGPNGYTLIADAGPQGSDGAGHGHADALSIQLSMASGELLVDPGTFVYVGPGRERQLFRGTSAHNTLSAGGADQAEAGGPFPWKTLPHVHVRTWIPGETFDLLVASHDGYRRLRSGGVMHERWIFGLKNSLCLVADIVEGRGDDCLEVNWHCSPEAQLRTTDNGAVVTRSGVSVAIIGTKDIGWTTETADTWYSPVYGCRTQARKLGFVYHGRLPVVFGTVLIPFTEAPPVTGELRYNVIERDGAHGFEYEHVHGWHTIVISRSRQSWRWRGVESDADLLYCGNGTITRKLIICRATYATVAGTRIFKSEHPIERIECAFDGDAKHISSSEPVVVSEAGALCAFGTTGLLRSWVSTKG